MGVGSSGGAAMAGSDGVALTTGGVACFGIPPV